MSDLPTGVHTRTMQAMADLKKEQRGKPASLGTLGERLGVSVQYLDLMLRTLAKRGYTERRGEGGSARWHLTDMGVRWLKKTREFVTDDPPRKK